MSFSYVVTSQKPTAVNFSVVCSFTSPDERNLIVARGNYLSVYSIFDNGISMSLETPLFGRIKCLETYRPSSSATDVLFILTERKSFFVVGYDSQNQKLVTRAVGNVKDRAGRDVEIGQRGLIDPDFRMIGMILYEGHIKVIPVEVNGMKEAMNFSLIETRILDIKFLYGCARPTLCMLYQDNRQVRHVKTLVLDTREKEATAGPWSQSNVEYGAHLIIPVPVPVGGILLVGASSITYIGQVTSSVQVASSSAAPSATSTQTQMRVQAVEISPALITSHACIAADGSRFLLSDHRGTLSVVVLRLNGNNEVTGLVVDTLGVTSIAENLSYLGDGLLFVGSLFGDSQLIKLQQEKDVDGSNVEVLTTYPNIGPIVDMVLVDNDKQGGQRQLVTCSGAYKDGSLRVIRSGIGMQEQASLDVPGIKGLWSLRTSEAAAFDKYLVQSFIGETRILAIENEEMGEVEIEGFSGEEATLYCGNMLGGTLVQVTTHSVRLVDAQTFQLVAEYNSPSTITVASGTLSQVTLAISGGELVYLELDGAGKQFTVKASVQLDQDIACLSLRPLGPAGLTSAGAMEVEVEENAPLSLSTTSSTSSLIAIAMWTDNTVRLHALPTLEEICRVPLGTDTQARDILLVELGGKAYLLVGLGDGRLITYTVDFSSDLPSLTSKRNGVLGTHPITFSCFQNAGALCVFAACDRPTVIYSKNGKILFSVLDVNQTEFTSMAPFHSEMFPGCLALCSEASLLIGVIEDIQKLHIQTIPLQQAPRRISHSSANSAYAVLAAKTSRTPNGEETMNRVLFFEDGSMEQIGIFELDRLEEGISCTTCVFQNNSPAPGIDAGSSSPAPSSTAANATTFHSGAPAAVEYFVVGTAHVVNGETEPSRGRLLVFEIVTNRRVHLIAEKEVKGGVFSLAQVCGRLVAGVGSKVSIYNLMGGKENLSNFTGQPELLHECTHSNQITSLFLKTKGDSILVGDVVRSMTLLRYKPHERALQEIARDPNSSYLRGVEILDGASSEDIFVGADLSGNLHCHRQQSDAVTDEQRSQLEACGEFHLGDYLNVLRRGSLVGQPIDADAPQAAAAATSKGPAEATISILSNNYHSITGLKVGTSCLLYGGVSGSIGNVISLSEDSYRFFAAVERVMKRTVLPTGGLNHRDWRSFQNELRVLPQRNMVDGDLVEMLLEFDRKQLEEVTREINDELNLVIAAANATGPAKSSSIVSSPLSTIPTGHMLLNMERDKLQLSVEDIVHRVEDMSRLH